MNLVDYQNKEKNLGQGALEAYKGVVEGDGEGYDALLYTCVKFSRIRKNYLCSFLYKESTKRWNDIVRFAVWLRTAA